MGVRHPGCWMRHVCSTLYRYGIVSGQFPTHYFDKMAVLLCDCARVLLASPPSRSLFPFKSASSRLWLEKGMCAASRRERESEEEGGQACWEQWQTICFHDHRLPARAWKTPKEWMFTKVQLHFPWSQNKIGSEFLIRAAGRLQERGLRQPKAPWR